MRFWAVLILVPVMAALYLVPAPASAEPASHHVAVFINGRELMSTLDMRPYINHRSRTMISVRAVSDHLVRFGCSASWLERSLEVEVSCRTRKLSFFFYVDESFADGTRRLKGVPMAYLNGRQYDLYTPPEMVGNRAFLGLRDLGELLEAKVSFEPGSGSEPHKASLTFTEPAARLD
jgi:hypothetical protein